MSLVCFSVCVCAGGSEHILYVYNICMGYKGRFSHSGRAGCFSFVRTAVPISDSTPTEAEVRQVLQYVRARNERKMNKKTSDFFRY